jgi:hypothetical protein
VGEDLKYVVGMDVIAGILHHYIGKETAKNDTTKEFKRGLCDEVKLGRRLVSPKTTTCGSIAGFE